MTPLRVFIGYDPREAVAYHVLAHSILRRASRPIAITSLALSQLGGLYTRPRDPRQSTDFTFTRFLVPYLCGYEGLAIYLDGDMLCLTDISDVERLGLKSGTEWGTGVRLAEVWTDRYSVLVCRHNYTPKTATKFLGYVQIAYPRKNWSSLMVFNNARCRALTPDYVNTASAADLHRFVWLKDEEIGALPLEWNWLVDEYPANPHAKILHYTLGGPWFPDQRPDHALEWFEEYDAMRRPMALSGPQNDLRDRPGEMTQ